MGIPIQKCPLDLWIYQDILCEVLPDVIIETGSMFGGSALYLAHICDILNHGKVVSVDITDSFSDGTLIERPKHDRITYITGSSVSQLVLDQLKTYDGKILVTLDSDHSKDHVLQELNLYAPFVSIGSYLIVEDTNVNGHPVCCDHGPGPFEAVTEFLVNNKNFQIDISREKFMMTQNPSGYLKRII